VRDEVGVRSEQIRVVRRHVEPGRGGGVSSLIPGVTAAVAVAIGAAVGGLTAVVAWSGRGGGCQGKVGGGILELFYPSVCSVAWRTGLAVGAIAGAGTAVWAATALRRHRAIVREAVTGLVASAFGIAGMAFGIYRAADLSQDDPSSFSDTSVYTKGVAGFVTGAAAVALVTVFTRVSWRRQSARTDLA
jgi:hypothetical protein